jgi:hypothetical protein
MMREAIETAMVNGFDLQKLVENKFGEAHPKAGKRIITGWNSAYNYGRRIDVGWRYAEEELAEECGDNFSIAELIYETDFIDKLVCGERDNCCLYSTHCSGEKRKKCDSFYETTKEKNTGKCGSSTYRNENYKQVADYHRREMANIKDIEKLKEYIRGLV